MRSTWFRGLVFSTCAFGGALSCAAFGAATETGPRADAASPEDAGRGDARAPACPARAPTNGCDRDCLGGACVDGGCAAVTIASGQGEPFALAIDPSGCGAGNVYWLDHPAPAGPCPTRLGEVHAAQKDGGAGHILSVDDPCLTDIAADEKWVTWTAYSTVRRSRIDGSEISLVASGQEAYFVGLNGDTAYWASRYDDTVFEHDVSQTSGACTDQTSCAHATTGSVVVALAGGGGGVYWMNQGKVDDSGAAHRSIWLSPHPSDRDASVSVALEQTNAQALATDGEGVYWGSNGNIWRAAPGGPSLIVAGSPDKMVVRDGLLFWIEGSTIIEAGTKGQNRHVAVTAERPIAAIAVDDLAIYWIVPSSSSTSADGRVMRIAR